MPTSIMYRLYASICIIHKVSHYDHFFVHHDPHDINRLLWHTQAQTAVIATANLSLDLMLPNRYTTFLQVKKYFHNWNFDSY